VAEAGDIAYDTGWIEMEVPGEGGAVETLRGKYVVVWEKVDDGWQVAVDILNLD
jgi:ketosteroid isomerase-like protein